jgi:hypothetical protein
MRLILSLVLALLMCLHSLASAYSEFDLSQINGTYEQGEVNFQLDIPQVHDLTSVWVELSGTQIPGLRATCEPPYNEPAGSEVEMVIRLPGLPEIFDYGASELPNNNGAWSKSFSLQPDGTHLYLITFGIPLDVEFRIGDLFPTTLCHEYLELAVTTITSARLVTDGVIPIDSSTWGTIKATNR